MLITPDSCFLHTLTLSGSITCVFVGEMNSYSNIPSNNISVNQHVGMRSDEKSNEMLYNITQMFILFCFYAILAYI